MGIFKAVKSGVRWMKDVVRSRDMYSKPISFTYKGDETFSTFIGGTVTIAILSCLMIFGFIKFMTMINRTDSVTSFNKIVADLGSDTTGMNLGESTFYFALNLQGNSSILLDSSYVDLTMKLFVKTSDNTTETSIDYSTCDQVSSSSM